MNEKFRLTSPQKRIWYSQLKHANSSLYNIGGTVRIKGKADVYALKQAIRLFIQLNDSVRLQMRQEENEVYQYVCDYQESEIDEINFINEPNPEKSFQSWRQYCAESAFEILDKPLYYFAIFKMQEEDMGYLIKFHHMIADGWSIKLITDEITQFYESIIKNGQIRNERFPSFLDYINNGKYGLQDENYRKAREFWSGQFSDLPEITYAVSRKSVEGRRKTFILERGIYNRINEWITRRNKSVNIFFICIYLLYEYKKYGKKDIIIGTPLLGRMNRKERQTFGMFVNQMPYRFKIDSEKTVGDTLSKIYSDMRDIYKYQNYEYDELCNQIGLHTYGLEKLYNVCINYYNTSHHLTIGTLPVENTEFYNGAQEYGLQIILRSWETDKLQIDFDYQTELYTEKQINEAYAQLLILIEQVLHNESLPIRDLLLLNQEGKIKYIDELNETNAKYPKDKTVIELFEEVAAKYPDRIAVSKDDEILSYSALKSKADQLAHHLIHMGVGPDTVVGALLQRNMRSVIAILAILKSGGIYFPIEISHPPNRILEILQAFDVTVALVDDHELDTVLGRRDRVVLSKFPFETKEVSVFAMSHPEDTAYMISTSGTSGIPKGVMVSHKNLMNYIFWAKNTYIKNDNEVFPLYSSFAFDFTMTSLFLPLINGNEIRIYDNHVNENVFHKIMGDNKATIVKITPSHIPLLNDTVFPETSIHTFIVGGEDLKTEACKSLYDQFNARVNIYNEYGPTEATVGCMIHLYNEADPFYPSVPIGKPISNTQIYLLDQDLCPVPNNTLGEIYISGEGVTKGYYKQEHATNRKYVENPYFGGSLLYRTGDAGYRNDEDILMYGGRLDNEIKIRGNRVNVSEIEAFILSSGMVRDAVVLYKEWHNESMTLTAYVIPNEGYREEDLKNHLELNLPLYMLPQFFIILDKFPLTINGKINKNNLPNPLQGVSHKENDILASPEKVAILLPIIRKVTNVEQVKEEDNFYAIGGDSIKAIQISSRLSEQGYELNVKDILTNPRIHQMVNKMAAKTASQYEQGIYSGKIRHTPITAWFLDQNFLNANHYNQSLLLRLKQNIPAKDIEEAFQKLIQHHDILRANYSQQDNCLYYHNNCLTEKFMVNELDLSDEAGRDYEKYISQSINPDFCLTKGILLKVYLLRTQKENLLYMTAHHLIMDGVSWRILLEDLETLLGQISNHDKMALPQKTCSYQQYADKLYEFAVKMKTDIAFWNQSAEKYSPFSRDLCRPSDTYGNSQTMELSFDAEQTHSLLTKANGPYNTKPNELLLIALALSLKQIYGENKIWIEAESHGRDILDGMDVSRTVGWFTNIFPLFLTIDSEDLSVQIKRLKEQIKSLWAKGYEFGIYKYIKRIPLPKEKCVRFNFLGEYVESPNHFFEMKRLLFASDVGSKNEIPFLIDINAIILDKKLTVYFTYGKNMILEDGIKSLVIHLKENMTTIIDHCCRKEIKEYTPSDFEMVSLTQEELDNLLE